MVSSMRPWRQVDRQKRGVDLAGTGRNRVDRREHALLHGRSPRRAPTAWGKPSNVSNPSQASETRGAGGCQRTTVARPGADAELDAGGRPRPPRHAGAAGITASAHRGCTERRSDGRRWSSRTRATGAAGRTTPRARASQVPQGLGRPTRARASRQSGIRAHAWWRSDTCTLTDSGALGAWVIDMFRAPGTTGMERTALPAGEGRFGETGRSGSTATWTRLSPKSMIEHVDVGLSLIDGPRRSTPRSRVVEDNRCSRESTRPRSRRRGHSATPPACSHPPQARNADIGPRRPVIRAQEHRAQPTDARLRQRAAPATPSRSTNGRAWCRPPGRE